MADVIAPKNGPIVAHICNRGAYIFVSDLTKKQIKYIHSTFTIKNKTIMGFWDITKCYSYYQVQGRPCILIPRFGLRVICEKMRIIARSQIAPGLPVTYRLSAIFRGNQKLVFDELMSTYFDSKQAKAGLAGVTIKLAAGQGKTYLSAHIINSLQLKTFIIVHNELLLNQWHKVIVEIMPEVNVGLFYGKKKTANADITIGIINSALNYDKWNEIGLCIFDEAHLYSSKGRAEIYDKCQSTYMCALSATPLQKKEQNDNSYKIIQWQIGPILNAELLPGYTTEDIPFQGKIHAIKYRGPPEFTHTIINERLGVVSNSSMINQATQDPFRKKLIIKLASEIIREPNIYLYIFASRRAYLEDIHAELINHANPNNILFLTNNEEEKKVSTIMGGSKDHEVVQAQNHSRIILSTYGFIGTGFSIVRFNSLILATPFKTGTEQYIGRIFRLSSDYTIRRDIYDIIDADVTLSSQYYSRKKFYNQKGYDIEVKNVSWVDLQ